MLNDNTLRKILIKTYKLTPAEERLFFTIREIYFFWGNKCECYASNEVLVNETNMSLGTVGRALKVLESKNLIKLAYEKTKGFLSRRNIYPLEDELLKIDVQSILDERSQLMNDKNEVFDDHIDQRAMITPMIKKISAPSSKRSAHADQYDHINNHRLNNINLNNIIDIPEVQNEADASGKTSFAVCPKTAFEIDPEKRWNEIATKFHLAKIHRLSETRISNLKKRIKECGSEKLFWETVEIALSDSKFLQGKETSWKASLDFFLQKSSFLKAAEGTYTTKKASLVDSDNASPMEQAANGYKPQSQAQMIYEFLKS